MSPKKRIEDLVCAGMVLDDRGNWIPLAKKLKKEREFLRHLENGEVLVKGTWTKMADIIRARRKTGKTEDSDVYDSPDPVNEETTIVSAHEIAALVSSSESLVFEETVQFELSKESLEDVEKMSPPLAKPEETVVFSTEALRDVSTGFTQKADPDDFPPETTMFRVSDLPDTRNVYTVDGKASDAGTFADDEVKSDVFPGKAVSDKERRPSEETEFEETVLYNTKILQNVDNRQERSIPDSGKGNSIQRKSGREHKAAFDAWEMDELKKKNRTTAVVIFIITLAVLLAVLKTLL